MILRWIGSALVVLATSAAGFHMAHSVRADSHVIGQLCTALETMQCEIRWNQSDFPQLCQLLSRVCSGCVAAFFAWLAKAMVTQPDAPITQLFYQGMRQFGFPKTVFESMDSLAVTFGRYDPEQQVAAVSNTLQQLQRLRQQVEQERQLACRKYELFGVCAGLAIVILLI